jgi:pimeloyl-ACP methyl ester carboxylesterase
MESVHRLDLGSLELSASVPPGREIAIDGRGTMLVRELPGPSGAPVLLLLHGLLASADLNWANCMEALATRFRVIAPDLRGHADGISTKRFTLADCADDVAELVRILDLGEVVVVGYSMGGPVAQLLWKRHPELVSGLVLCATGLRFPGVDSRYLKVARGLLLTLPERARRSLMTRALCRRGAADSAQQRRVLAQVAKHDTRAILDACRELGRFDSSEWMVDVDVPTAIVQTTIDQVVTAAEQARIHATIAGSTMFHLEGDHFVCVNQPHAFSSVLGRACDEVAGAGAAAERVLAEALA